MSEALPVASESAGFSIDFGALREQASAMLDAPTPAAAVATSEVVPPVVDKVETPVETPKVEATPVVEDTPTEIKLADLADDAHYKVVVDGEEVVVSGKDLKGGYSRTSTFTKRMQTLAKERDTFESERGTLNQLRDERAQLERFLTNRDAVVNYVRKTFGEEAPAAKTPQQIVDSGEIATVGQAREIAEQQARTFEERLQAMDAAVNERIQAATAEIAHREQTAKHANVIGNTLTEIFTATPVLKSIPNAEDLIRYEVFKMKPATEAEAVEAFRQVAQGMAENIGQHYKAQTKITKVAETKAKLESKSIEPANGTAPSLPKMDFKNTDGSVNWNLIRKTAENYGA